MLAFQGKKRFVGTRSSKMTLPWSFQGGLAPGLQTRNGCSIRLKGYKNVRNDGNVSTEINGFR